VNRVAEQVVGSVAIPKSAESPKRESDGFLQIGVDVVFHLDVLKPTLRKGVGTHTKKQMSLDLEDL
jgi:hypothetical protein